MSYFQVDTFIDILVLVLHHNEDEVYSLVNKYIETYESEKKAGISDDDEACHMYIHLIKEVMATGTVHNNRAGIDAYLLKIKNTPTMARDPELYSTLRGIFSDTEPLDDRRYKYIMSKMTNALVWDSQRKLANRLYGKVLNAPRNHSKAAQETILAEMNEICNSIVSMNTNHLSSEGAGDDVPTVAKFVDFTDVQSIKKAMTVFKLVNDTYVYRTGWQGLNRALGNGGIRMGESLSYNAPSHGGKALRIDEPVLVPGGWKKIGQLNKGDDAIAVDGTIMKVTGVFPQGMRTTYDVVFEDGRSVVADGEHLWAIQEKSGLHTTCDIIRLMKKKDIHISLTEGTDVDDPEDRETVIGYYRYGRHSNARIPKSYFHACRNKRWSLLQGILDKHGIPLVPNTHMDPSSCICKSNNKRMAKDIQKLAWSLGCICHRKKMGNAYFNWIITSHPEKLFDNETKRKRIMIHHNQYVIVGLKIASITKREEKEECVCITVDHPSKLFITRDYIVTHNSLILMKNARWITTYNKAPKEFEKPVCLVYSLENETPYNLMMMFEEMYINKYKELPPKELTDDEILQYCQTEFSQNGWRLIIDRRMGTDFGYDEFVNDFNRYKAEGYSTLVVIVDYINKMKKSADKKDGNHLAVRELYDRMVNFTKVNNCTLITAHQLNRDAVNVIKNNPTRAVDRLGVEHLADSTDPQREIDCSLFMCLEYNQHKDKYFTCRVDKHRYDNGKTPDAHKRFAYKFEGELGILDDLFGEDKSVRDIYASTKRAVMDEDEDDFL